MRIMWMSMVVLLTACPRAEKPVVVAPPTVVSPLQPRLVYRRSEPVHLERWCESAADGLLARDQGKVLLVRADGSVRRTSLEGFPCQTDGELLSFRAKGDSVLLSRELPGGGLEESRVPPLFGCIARGGEVTLLRTDICAETQKACGSIELRTLATGASATLVPYGRNVPLHAAWVGSELIWTGLFESAFGVWSTVAGATKKLIDSPAPQTMCCELAASKEVVLLAEQERLLRLDRGSGKIHAVFEAETTVRSVVFDDAQHATFAYGARIASLSLKDEKVTTLAATSSRVDRVVHSGERLLWCQQDGVYMIP